MKHPTAPCGWFDTPDFFDAERAERARNVVFMAALANFIDRADAMQRGLAAACVRKDPP